MFEFGKDEEGKDLPKTVISREYSSEWKLGDEIIFRMDDIKPEIVKQARQELTEEDTRIRREI